MRISVSPGLGMLTMTPRAPLMFGMGRVGRLGLTCGTGLSLRTLNVAGGIPSGVNCGPVSGGEASCCCGDPSSPTYNALEDPCSYFNTNAALLAAQAASQTPAAVAAATGNNQIAVAIASYPENVQEDAYTCWGNPGASFTDNAGQKVNCPSASTPGPAGSPISTYTVEQLAAMIDAGVGPGQEQAFNTATYVPASTNTLNNVAPTKSTVVSTPPQSNALANSAAQTNMATPSASQITAGQNVTANPNTSVGVNSSTDSTEDAAINWIEGNWMLLAAGLAALVILPSLLHRG